MTIKEYNQVVDNYTNDLYRFILSNIKNEDDAEDIIQDAFEKVWIKRESIDFSKAKSYLFSTAYHNLIDKVRRDKKKADFDELDTNQLYHTKQYSDLQEILHESIAKLPQDQQAVILLRDYEGYRYDEIAEITGLSEAQVKVYIYRARVFLKKYIGKMENVL